MKKCLLTLSIVLLLFSAKSQTTDGDVYLYKKDGSQTSNIKEAVTFQHVFKVDDTTYIARLYQAKGPMIAQETFKDSALTIPNGLFCWYDKEGRIDSSGEVANKKKDGYWYNFDDQLHRIKLIGYNMGKKEKEETYLYDKKGKRIEPDSIKKDTTNAADKDVEASYKTGVQDWVSYCSNNLKTPERLMDILGYGKHTVKVCFLVDKEGRTGGIFLLQSCEWTGDAEAMRLIQDSPIWQPATHNGKKVVYRQIQELNYLVK